MLFGKAEHLFVKWRFSEVLNSFEENGERGKQVKKKLNKREKKANYK